MEKIPERLRKNGIIPELAGLLVSQGKVRDTYHLEVEDLPIRLVVTTKRISAFDFVWPVLIPNKGAVLTALDHFWRTQVLADFPHHLIPSRIRDDRNFAYDLRGRYPDIDLRCTLATTVEEIPRFEYIFRYHPGGSIWNEYCEKGTMAGKVMEKGIKKWSKLPIPVFTPSTKELDGHDRNLSIVEFLELADPWEVSAALMFQCVYMKAYEWAASRGVIILDSKFEGRDLICDEILTFDSSRFTTKKSLVAALEKSTDPDFYDKEVFRAYGRDIATPFYKDEKQIIGVHRLDPLDESHVAFVHSLDIPDDVALSVTNRGLELFRMITGMELFDYQQRHLC